jgi:hypothetical protein
MSAITEQPTRAANVNVATVLPTPGFILYVGRVISTTGETTATVCCITEGGDSVVFKGVRVGSFLPVKILRLLPSLGADTTTAANTRGVF